MLFFAYPVRSNGGCLLSRGVRVGGEALGVSVGAVFASEGFAYKNGYGQSPVGGQLL